MTHSISIMLKTPFFPVISAPLCLSGIKARAEGMTVLMRCMLHFDCVHVPTDSVVFYYNPIGRNKSGSLLLHMGSDFLHFIYEYKRIEILEASLCPDHVHMLVSIPPMYSVSSIVGYLSRALRLC